MPRDSRAGRTPTTEPGYVNRNDQRVVRGTGLSGNDHMQLVYVLACGRCGHEYGANGSDIFQRKCPECQGGAPGLACDVTPSSERQLMTTTSFTASGVTVADDFRDNLIIDRHDPVFSGMRASKLKHLRSANSEDAVTWNAFRSLRQVSPSAWVPALFRAAFPSLQPPSPEHATVAIWKPVAPPPALLLSGDEGVSELDIVIESPNWVWVIEAKYRSDISTGTTTRPARDQLLRNIDVGSFYAGVRPFFCSLLVAAESTSAQGLAKVREYAELDRPRALLAGHRPDGLGNLQAVSALFWHQVGAVLKAAAAETARDDERVFPERAYAWLLAKGLAAEA